MAMRISVDTPRHGRISMEAPAMIRLAIFFFMVEGLMSSIMRLRSVCGFCRRDASGMLLSQPQAYPGDTLNKIFEVAELRQRSGLSTASA